MKGTVVKSTGSWYYVRLEGGNVLPCRIRGKFRIEGIKTTNPVAVGDHVSVELEDTEEAGVITDIEKRSNHIIRKATKLSKQSHIIAANLDQAMLVVTMEQPDVRLGFIDRFLVTAEAYHIPVFLVFNKKDIYSPKSFEKLETLIALYESLGYPCLVVSAYTKENLAKVHEKLLNKTTLVAGHSGVGKSTLINTIEPGLELKTASVSEYNQKGTHTTTFAEMYPLQDGGDIIDTPGIKSFGVIDIPEQELSHYFPEMRELLPGCKFHNCVHINEPGCAVKEALVNGEIAESRFENYMHLYHNEDW